MDYYYFFKNELHFTILEFVWKRTKSKGFVSDNEFPIINASITEVGTLSNPDDVVFLKLKFVQCTSHESFKE